MLPKIELEIPSLALEALSRVIRKHPKPQIDTELAQFAAHAIANHLIFLILTASDANVAGRHSVAISLFRNMEDAFDCFGAVALIPRAAEKWAQGKLKASQAARICESKLGTIKLPSGETAVEYRKNLRSHFNQFAHCTPHVTEWDLYPHFDPSEVRKLMNDELEGNIQSELRVNTDSRVLPQNAVRIGAFLVAHTVEFSYLIEMGYESFLNSQKALQKEVRENTNKLEGILKKDLVD